MYRKFSLPKLGKTEWAKAGYWAMELIIVVAGVFIALWAQERSQDRREMADLARERANLDEYIQHAYGSYALANLIGRCQTDQLESLRAALLQPGAEWSAPAQGFPGDERVFDADGPSWPFYDHRMLVQIDSLSETQVDRVVAAMPAEEAQSYRHLLAIAEVAENARHRRYDEGGKLLALGLGGPISMAERRRHLETIGAMERAHQDFLIYSGAFIVNWQESPYRPELSRALLNSSVNSASLTEELGDCVLTMEMSEDGLIFEPQR